MGQYFSIIQSLCRSFVGSDMEVVQHQIERLAKAFEKDGYSKEAASLRAICANAEKTENLLPQNLSLSFAIAGEDLRRNTPVPVDKETAAPILEVIFEEDLPIEHPMFDSDIYDAINSVVLEWMNYGRLVEVGAKPARSCLIYGLPGTGKTHLAKWMARMMGLPVVLAKLDGIVSSFLGTSSRNISNLFTFANRYKCILLLDEFDAIAKLRDDPQEVGEVKRIVNTLLQCLDERDKIGFTIGITNHEQLLDPAIWRRFDVQVEIPKPSSNVILMLLTKYLSPLKFGDADLKFLTWCLSDATGADVEKMSNWIKRQKIITQYKDDSIISMMRRYCVLNTGRVTLHVRETVEKSNEEIYAILKEDGVELKQKEVAAMMNLTASSLSKQLSKIKK